MSGVTLGNAMVLAAGLGSRMQPLTAATAKPLLCVAGRSLLDYALDRLEEAGIERTVVNTHWCAEKVADRLRARTLRETGRMRVLRQDEPVLLGNGGALAQALASGALPPHQPFAVVNGDSLWLDGPVPAIARLARRFDDETLDALLLVARSTTVIGQVGAGDFSIDENGAVRRPHENEIVPYVFAGVQILSPRLFQAVPEAPFSCNLIWDRAISGGRIAALVHDGPWFHLSRPADIADTERAIRDPLFGPSNT